MNDLRETRMKFSRIYEFNRCEDGTLLVECILDENVTRDLIDHFRNFGTLKLTGNLIQPFYTFETDGLLVKGVIGDCGMYLQSRKEDLDISLSNLREILAKYSPGERIAVTDRCSSEGDFLWIIEGSHEKW